MLVTYIILGLIVFILLKEDKGVLANNGKEKCINCGKRIDDGSLYCQHCGEMLKKNCHICEKLIEIDWRYCPFCGNTEANTSKDEG